MELQVQDHGLAEPAIQAEPKLQDCWEQEPEAVLGTVSLQKEKLSSQLTELK